MTLRIERNNKMIDWINPSQDVLEAKRIGYNEGVNSLENEMAELIILREIINSIKKIINKKIADENLSASLLKIEIAGIIDEDE